MHPAAMSPETARRDLMAQYARWLASAGLDLPPGAGVEIDHAQVDGPDDLAAAGFRSPSDAGDVIRIEPGARP